MSSAFMLSEIILNKSWAFLTGPDNAFTLLFTSASSDWQVLSALSAFFLLVVYVSICVYRAVCCATNSLACALRAGSSIKTLAPMHTGE